MLLLLQSAASAQGAWSMRFHGLWGRSAVVVLSPSPPPAAAADSETGEGQEGPCVELILSTLDAVFRSAGLSGWAFPTGSGVDRVGFEIARTQVADGDRCAHVSLVTDGAAAKAAAQPSGTVRLYPEGSLSLDQVSAAAADFVRRQTPLVDDERRREREKAATLIKTKKKGESKKKAEEDEPATGRRRGRGRRGRLRRGVFGEPSDDDDEDDSDES
jgi:hypothetical protein